jgi:FmdE, Molybdenum formylmethanofuran dehydrogenase operon
MMDCIAPSRVALSSKFVQSTWYDVVIKSAYSIAARFGAGGAASMGRIPVVLCLAIVLGGATTAPAETPDEWIKLLTRVHGGFGSFLPVGIRIGEDAMKRLGAKPRDLSVVFYQGEGTPCPCAADGVSLAVYSSAGHGTLQIAGEKSPPGTFAAVVIRPRKGGEGLRYTVPMAMMPKLGEINATISDPRGRYDAVMGIPDLYTVEVVK